MGSVFYPCYDLDNAEAVTMSGQTVTRQMVRFTNELLNKLMVKNGEKQRNDGFVIAGDTDSCKGNTLLKIKTIKKVIINNENNQKILLQPYKQIKVKRNNKQIFILAKDLKQNDQIERL